MHKHEEHNNDDPLIRQVDDLLRKDREDMFYDMLRHKTVGGSFPTSLKFFLPLVIYLIILCWVLLNPEDVRLLSE